MERVQGLNMMQNGTAVRGKKKGGWIKPISSEEGVKSQTRDHMVIRSVGPWNESRVSIEQLSHRLQKL